MLDPPSRGRPRSPSTPGAWLLGWALLGACSAPQAGTSEAQPPELASGSAEGPLEPAVEAAALASTTLSAPPEAAPPAVEEVGANPEDEARRRAQELIEAGEYGRARAILDDLQAAPLLEEARRSVRAGDLEQALASAGRALELSPAHVPSILLRGECQAALGERSGDPRGLELALETFLRAPDSAAALLAASRAARRLDRPFDALELAERAFELPDIDASAASLPGGPWPSELPERTLCEAALAAWRARLPEGRAAAALLLEKAEQALALLLARTPDDPWVWRALSEAYLEAGRPAEAPAALERALDRIPRERGLMELLSRAAIETRTPGAIHAAFERLQAERPEIGLYWWFPAVRRFESSVAQRPDTRERFKNSELEFRACRAKDPTTREDCLRYEALCRTGQGWCWLAEGRLEQARDTFRSTEELFVGALDLGFGKAMDSAAVGLQAVIDAGLAQGALEEAADLALLLSNHSPEDPRLALQAAQLGRDLADQVQLLARDLELAGEGKLASAERLQELRALSALPDGLRGTGRERELMAQSGERRRAQARAAYQRSLQAFRRLIELRPEDVRARCDAAELAVQRLGSELLWAEANLVRCVEQGQLQLARGELDGEAAFALEEAVGDACQLLGVLNLEHKSEPKIARSWFERSLEIGPLPRPEVVEHYLPRCAALGG